MCKSLFCLDFQGGQVARQLQDPPLSPSSAFEILEGVQQVALNQFDPNSSLTVAIGLQGYY